MINYDLFLSRAAVNDIEHVVNWYETQRIGLGYEFELSLQVGLTSIQQNPHISQKRYRDIRVKFIKRFPYGIHYQIESTNIKVIALFHMKQDPIKWEKRFDQKDLK